MIAEPPLLRATTPTALISWSTPCWLSSECPAEGDEGSYHTLSLLDTLMPCCTPLLPATFVTLYFSCYYTLSVCFLLSPFYVHFSSFLFTFLHRFVTVFICPPPLFYAYCLLLLSFHIATYPYTLDVSPTLLHVMPHLSNPCNANIFFTFYTFYPYYTPLSFLLHC